MLEQVADVVPVLDDLFTESVNHTGDEVKVGSGYDKRVIHPSEMFIDVSEGGEGPASTGLDTRRQLLVVVEVSRCEVSQREDEDKVYRYK